MYFVLLFVFLFDILGEGPVVDGQETHYIA
jgi:hypothetical protein